MNRLAVPCDIIIVNYNTREKVLGCLASVFSSLPHGGQVWVVDNGSSDGSYQAIEKEFPQVNLIRSENNRGFGAGANLAAIQAKKEFLIFLNPDTTVENGWIEALLGPFLADPKVGLTTSKILLLNRPNQINACGNAVHFTGITLCRGLGLNKAEFDRLEEVAAVSGAALAARREIFSRLNGFDEDMFLYMEDTDLSWRVWLSGMSCVFVPKSVVFHEYSFRLAHRKIFFQERNRYLLLLKNFKWPTLLLLLPGQVLAEIITWGFVLWKHRSALNQKWMAYRWILAHWHDVMKKRKNSQSLRKIPDRELLKRTSSRFDFYQIDKGKIAFLCKMLFNPIFLIFHRFTLAMTRW